MRVRTFWTIGNQHTAKVFYGMYLPADTTFIKTGGGHEGWLEAGKAIDMEVDFPQCKIVFWKDKPFLGMGDKLADPKLVTTDRPVTFTRQKTVVQPDEAEFTDPAHIGAVIFLTEMEFNNLIRGLVLMAIGKVPKVGGAVSGLLGFIWPEQKRDLIAESEARMKRWVQGRLHDYDRSFLRNTLSGLRRNLDEYRQASGRKERARWFDISLAACERAMPFFTKDEYTPGTVDLAASVATLHLTLLRERVLFTREIFDEDDVNEAHFKQSLKETIGHYQTFIRDVAIPGELKWRQEQIVDDKQIGELRYLTDWVTREVHRFSNTGRHQLHQGPSQVCVDYYREQVESALARQLRENVYHTALFWTLLDPDQQDAQPIPLDSVTWSGPLAGLGYMVGNEHNFKHGDSPEDRTGRITEVVVWAGDRIDGLQFNAEGRVGRHYGTSGGTRRSVPVPTNAFLTKIETWFDFDLWGIKFHFSDGSSSGPFGHTWRGGVHQTAEFPRHHITAVRVGNRMEELRCGFTPLPNYYELVQQ
jgi:hypothetical protein